MDSTVLPHYLDDPDGEFWFEKKGNGGRLFLRLPGDADPNRVRIEAGKRKDQILGRNVRHVEISGLDFRFTTPHWDLTVAMWDFGTKPWGYREDAHPASIRVWGDGEDIRIANNRFEHVTMPIILRATSTPNREKGKRLDHILIEDNEFRHTDVGILSISDGSGWGVVQPEGFVGDVRVYRNRGLWTGYRPDRYQRGTGMDFRGARTLHVAGNVLERIGAQGINTYSGKTYTWGAFPLTRTLIHTNKIWHSMQISNDFGGIEHWNNGPVYIYNNLSYDSRGMWEGRRSFHKQSPGFGHAYYLDHGNKAYLFNNIAWGRSNDPTTKLVNCSAFQEIKGRQNSYFNNTAYNFYVGSRRQAPHPGRNRYLGNIWQDMHQRAFRHADPARTRADGNAHHAGEQKTRFNTQTNAYAHNVFHNVNEIGVFEPSGRWLKTLEDFQTALRDAQVISADLGTMADRPPLRDPAEGDFRLAPGSAAVDNGAVMFVPWALASVVGEWNFFHAGDDHTRIIDEHWFSRPYPGSQHPAPLRTVNVEPDDYESGALDNWVDGVLRLTADRQQYAMIANAALVKPRTGKASRKSRHEGGKPEDYTIPSEDLKNPQVHEDNLLIEVYFQADAGATGLLVGKMAGTGYELRLDERGRAVFTLAGAGGARAELVSRTVLNRGQWRHLLVEADREAETLTIYVDGVRDQTGPGIGRVSLANESDFFVGGTADGDHFSGRLQFLRLALGTLAEADTTIEELYAWQFDGPALRDMRGVKPRGGGRDAGAVESF